MEPAIIDFDFISKIKWKGEVLELQREKRDSERLLFLHGNCNKMERGSS